MGLRVDSLHFPTRRTYFDQDYLNERIAATKTVMEFAYQLRTQVVTIRIGRIPQDPASTDYQLLREVLGDLARHGNRVGTSVAIIPSQDSVSDLQQLLGGITEGMVGIDFDPAGCVLAKQNPAEALRSASCLGPAHSSPRRDSRRVGLRSGSRVGTRGGRLERIPGGDR